MAMASAARSMASRIARAQSSGSAHDAHRQFRRPMSSGGGHEQGPPKVNCWEAPLSMGAWHEHQVVIVCLSGWGLVFYSAYKYFTREKK